MPYETFVYLLPRGSNHEHPALAGFVYDEDYLKNTFFPNGIERSVAGPESERSVTSSTLDHDSEGKRADSFGLFGLLEWRMARSGARFR